jgi:hypothetical protein
MTLKVKTLWPQWADRLIDDYGVVIWMTGWWLAFCLGALFTAALDK